MFSHPLQISGHPSISPSIFLSPVHLRQEASSQPLLHVPVDLLCSLLQTAHRSQRMSLYQLQTQLHCMFCTQTQIILFTHHTNTQHPEAEASSRHTFTFQCSYEFLFDSLPLCFPLDLLGVPLHHGLRTGLKQRG